MTMFQTTIRSDYTNSTKKSIDSYKKDWLVYNLNGLGLKTVSIF
jgi:hypothetical protein